MSSKIITREESRKMRGSLVKAYLWVICGTVSCMLYIQTGTYRLGVITLLLGILSIIALNQFNKVLKPYEQLREE